MLIFFVYKGEIAQIYARLKKKEWGIIIKKQKI